MVYLAICAFLTIPVLSVIYFITSAVSYSSGKKKNRQNPDAVSAEEMKSRKRSLIISSCLAGFIVTATIAVTAMFYIGIAYM